MYCRLRRLLPLCGLATTLLNACQQPEPDFVLRHIAGKADQLGDAVYRGYRGAPDRRNNELRLVVDGKQARAVSLAGEPLVEHSDRDTFDAAQSGWFNAGGNLVLVRSGARDVKLTKRFTIDLR